MKKITQNKKRNQTSKWPTAVDLFCGSGAVTEALKRRHFRVVAAIDNDPIACATYRLNHPTVYLLERDICKIDPWEIRKKTGRNDIDLLVACAPCQPFSNQNRNRTGDPRASLILETARFAKILKPKIIFFENVPGLASSNSKTLDQLKVSLSPQYVLGKPQRIDAADFGVPQRRVRCILLAARNQSPPELPQPMTPEGKRVTVRQAIFELPRLHAGEKDPDDDLHAARKHREIALKRLAAIPKNGGSRSALPQDLELACHVEQRGYPDVYGRMEWDDVAPTLTTGCTDITRGRFAHPDDDRAITLREAALLQTFPEDYEFLGNASEIATQIGNAVPVQLVNALLPTLRQLINVEGN
jgi:DNA (cytosine-5)-methyltransferase 1